LSQVLLRFASISIFFPHVRRRRDSPRSHLTTPPPRLGDPAAAPSTSTPPTRSERQRGRGMAKARSSAKQSRAQAQQSNGGGGHALSSKLARYLDPEASWNKVRPAPQFPRERILSLPFLPWFFWSNRTPISRSGVLLQLGFAKTAACKEARCELLFLFPQKFVHILTLIWRILCLFLQH